jgi:outer membrane protein OmpA-like peptidoglycan-associated protein
MVNFRNAVASLKTPGVQAVFDGNSVNLGGVIADADRDSIAASLKNVLGGGLVFGTLANRVADMVATANSKAATELASLKPGFAARDVVAALNQSVINFPSNGAAIPASESAFLEKAAADLKQLPKGTQIEIAGYTDNTGDQAANVALSQQRAEAVRDALVQAGVDPGMLVAKGYGSANPVASNDLYEGRVRNRRIEYHLMKT